MGARGLGRSGGRRPAGKRPQEWATGLQCLCPLHRPGRASVDAGRLVSPRDFPSAASVAPRNFRIPPLHAGRPQGPGSILVGGWMCGCVDGRVDGWVDGGFGPGSILVGGWKCGCVDGCVDVWMDVWMGGWMVALAPGQSSLRPVW
eukprot:354286-Chlamydomonas_euryale.AAC.7